MSARGSFLGAFAIAALGCSSSSAPAATCGSDAGIDVSIDASDASFDSSSADAPPPGMGTDPGVVAACTANGCHADVAAKWTHPSSHSLLDDCTTCHHVVPGVSVGPGHVEEPGCDRCHSEATHLDGVACTACHDPHGSANAFLIRENVAVLDGGTAPVHVVAPEGASLDGLVRQGVDGGVAGTGLCEVCHTTTFHYTRDGKGAPHQTVWCAQCHDHARGFSKPATY